MIFRLKHRQNTAGSSASSSAIQIPEDYLSDDARHRFDEGTINTGTTVSEQD
jgi:hypothetical protein